MGMNDIIVVATPMRLFQANFMLRVQHFSRFEWSHSVCISNCFDLFVYGGVWLSVVRFRFRAAPFDLSLGRS